jgi:hypothetical protein
MGGASPVGGGQQGIQAQLREDRAIFRELRVILEEERYVVVRPPISD